MAVSFGDFKPDEIYNLIENKDPLGLNNDIQGHLTTNNPEKDMEYDAIPHYIKMASTVKMSNVNNNANSNPESEDTKSKDTIPSQVNYPSTSRNIPYNTRLASVSSNNLSCKVSFKSFENIQQSCKRSCTNFHDEITGASSDSNLNSNLISNSNESLDEFNNKTSEIIKGLHELHFSTIDLRNKLKGRVNNDHPIITQVTGRNNASTTNQVRVYIYPPGQSCWHEIRGFLHKEMNLWIKAAYYEALNKNEIYPPGQLHSCPPRFDIQSKEGRDNTDCKEKSSKRNAKYSISIMSTQEANECKTHVDASTQALRTYYQQEGASSYNLNETLDAVVTLTDRSQKTVHSEQQKRFLDLSNKPTLALYMGFPDQLIQAEIKNHRLPPFLPLQGEEPIQAHPGG